MKKNRRKARSHWKYGPGGWEWWTVTTNSGAAEVHLAFNPDKPKKRKKKA